MLTIEWIETMLNVFHEELCRTNLGQYVLYYVLKSRDVPVRVKAEILGALGYVLVPLDLIPDFIPVVGFSDDLAAVTFVVQQAHAQITPGIQKKAEKKVFKLIGSTDECELAA